MNKQPSAFTSFNLPLQSQIPRDFQTLSTSKSSEHFEALSKNSSLAKMSDLQNLVNRMASNTDSTQMKTWSSPSKNISRIDAFETYSKASLMINKGYKNEPENLSKRNNTFTSYQRDTEASSKEEPKSYSQIWKSGRDTKDEFKNKSSVNTSQEIIEINSYYRQHFKRKLKKSLAAKIIQKWFRECRKRKQIKLAKSNPTPKQEWCNILTAKTPLNQKLENRKAKKTPKKNNNNIKLKNPTDCYEYEELETDQGSLPMRGDVNQQNKMLEEVYKQLRHDNLDRGRKVNKENHNSEGTFRHSIKDGSNNSRSYLSLEQSPNKMNSFLKDKLMLPLKTSPSKHLSQLSRKSTDRPESWERSLREPSVSFKDYERASIKIQRAFRRYLRMKYKGFRSTKKNGYGSRNQSFESLRKAIRSEASEDVEKRGSAKKEFASKEKSSLLSAQLSSELVLANQNVIRLQKENEGLKKILNDVNSKIEIIVEEKLMDEKSKFKDMLDEYTQFVDKLLQEKVDLTQYYEMVAQNNKDLKAQLHRYEGGMKEQEKVMFGRLEEELESYKLENEKLRIVINELEVKAGKDRQEIVKYHETLQANFLLLKKLQSSESYAKELEDRLRIIENKGRDSERESSDRLGHQLRGAPVNMNQSPQMSNGSKQEKSSPEKNFNFPRLVINSNTTELILEPKQTLSQKSESHRRRKEEEDDSAQKENADSDRQSITESQKVEKQAFLNIPQTSHFADIEFQIKESDSQKKKGSPSKLESEIKNQFKGHEEDHMNFSFEARGSVFIQDQAESFKADSDSEDIHQKEKSKSYMLEQIREVNETQASGDLNNQHIEINRLKEIRFGHSEELDFFGHGKPSNEYFSGKFPDHHEHLATQDQNDEIQEVTTDDEQNLEINNLILNISRKLELAKNSMDERVTNFEKKDDTEDINPHKEIVFSRAFSSHEFNQIKTLPSSQDKGFRRSTQSLRNGVFTLEEENEGTHETQAKRKKEDKKDGNVKKGIMDTLKKAELIFGR